MLNGRFSLDEERVCSDCSDSLKRKREREREERKRGGETLAQCQCELIFVLIKAESVAQISSMREQIIN